MGEQKVCSNGPGHMTKMATTPIYGKTPLYIYIIGFLIDVQVQGHHPHQWAPFQVIPL